MSYTTSSPGKLSTLQPVGVMPQNVVRTAAPQYVSQPVSYASTAPVAVVAAAPVSYNYMSGVGFWILIILISFVVIMAILYMLLVGIVTDTLPTGEVVINTQKLFLWSLFFTLILWLLMWLFSKWGMCMAK